VTCIVIVFLEKTRDTGNEDSPGEPLHDGHLLAYCNLHFAFIFIEGFHVFITKLYICMRIPKGFSRFLRGRAQTTSAVFMEARKPAFNLGTSGIRAHPSLRTFSIS
jgi:hypothetical protein